MTRTLFALVSTGALLATAASADQVSLERQIQAGSLHHGDVAMVAYYLDRQDHYEVVATFADGMSEPMRIRMGLVDGDETTFGLPGIPGISFTFARNKGIVKISSDTNGEMVARAR